jgi:uncharacterized protein (TIGR03067 family)
MMSLRSLAIAAVALGSLFAVQADDKKPAKFDAEKILGKYTFTSGEKYGKAVDAETLKKATFEIEKDKLIMPTPEGKFVFSYKIDAATEPMGIDLEITDGPVGKDMKSKGIIKVDGETVTICYPVEPDAARPKEFKSDEKAKTMLFVLKKAK